MNDCCGLEENLGETEQVSEDVTVRRCLVCGAKHIEIVLEDESLAMEVGPL